MTDRDTCGPLPVTLIGSSTGCHNRAAVVEWTTASEQDCAEFVVERSDDAQHWQPVGRVG